MEHVNDRRFVNWGKNRRFAAAEYFEPASESELLGLLDAHEGRRFRAIGSLHSWSEVPGGDDIIVNLKHLNGVAVEAERVEIGAGCTIEHAIRMLREHGLTLPTVGMANRQQIAGVVATATHGSGRPSLSHYVSAFRIATYDAGGKAAIIDVDAGSALEATRCSLGCIGIIVSLQIECVERFLVGEKNEKHFALSTVIERAKQNDLTQFYLMPWSWTWFVQFRNGDASERSNILRRFWYRVIRILTLGATNSLTVLFVRILRSRIWIRRLYRGLSKKFRLPSVVNDSDRVLIVGHWWRYVEMELFVAVAKVDAAACYVEEVLRSLADGDPFLSSRSLEIIKQTENGLEDFETLNGQYVHHYPITFRLVRKDASLLSMSSKEDCYAISFISFKKNDTAFENVCGFFARTMSTAFEARPHWGKVFPLDKREVSRLYPDLDQFESACRQVDPNGVFANEFSRRVLGF